MNKTIGQTYFLKVKELNLDGGSRTDFAADIIDLELHPEREKGCSLKEREPPPLLSLVKVCPNIQVKIPSNKTTPSIPKKTCKYRKRVG